MAQTWSPSGYAQHAGFVPALGAGILEKLAPVAGERILDLGCGDGAFFRLLWPHLADVVGVDLDPAAVEAARQSGVYREVHGVAAHALSLTHWTTLTHSR